jgi:hypothetical protein
MKNDIQDSTGNIFLDLGYSREDAEILRMRADLNLLEVAFDDA